jgi:hypothetical protein
MKYVRPVVSGGAVTEKLLPVETVSVVSTASNAAVVDTSTV